MIFKQWRQVLDGTKTQTRRLVKNGDRLHTISNHDESPDHYVAQASGRIRWKTWHTYAVQPGRGREAVGRIRITEIRRERLQDISQEDIIAEGIFRVAPSPTELWFYSGATDYYTSAIFAFQALWNSIHKKPGTRWEDDPEVWVLSFELV